MPATLSNIFVYNFITLDGTLEGDFFETIFLVPVKRHKLLDAIRHIYQVDYRRYTHRHAQGEGL